MRPKDVSTSQRREALQILVNHGPVSHEEFSEYLGLDWDDVQTIVRVLRSDGLAVISLDRRYEATDKALCVV